MVTLAIIQWELDYSNLRSPNAPLSESCCLPNVNIEINKTGFSRITTATVTQRLSFPSIRVIADDRGSGFDDLNIFKKRTKSKR